jgi:hypothetical protein
MKCRARTIEWAIRLVFALLLALQCAGCTSSPGGIEPAGSRKCDVAIGAISADLRSEQEGLFLLLKAHGIEMYLEGSRMYDVLVPANQAEPARALLATNELVSKGLLRVWRQEGAKK